MVFFLFTFLQLSESLVLYHFGLRFGQVFMNHYSENYRIALSGFYASIDDYDIIPTDRGAYFPKSCSLIKIYPNQKWNYYTPITSKFSMATWLMVTGSKAGLIYSRKLNVNNNFFIAHDTPYQRLLFRLIQNSVTTEYSSSVSSFPDGNFY